MSSQGWDEPAASHGGSEPTRLDVRTTDPGDLNWRIVESLHEGVVVHDFRPVIRANRSARRIIGLAPDAALTDEALKRVHLVRDNGERLRDEDRVAALAAMRTGPSQLTMLGGICRPDGELRWCVFN